MEKNVTVSETLHKNSKVYLDQNDYEVLQDQDDGGCRDFKIDYKRPLKEIYKEQSFTLEELLEAIPQFLESIKLNLDEKMKSRADVYINTCRNWIQDELEVIED